MCHPAWGPACSPAPVPEGRREGAPAVDQQRLWDAEAAHDGARRLPLDVAALALAACSGIPPAQLTREFTHAYGASPEECASAGGSEEPLPPDVPGLRGLRGLRGEEMPCASVIAPAFNAGL
ncbi:hypothetical protein [Sinomonas sp. RB5]